jgi:hypothetical protein
MSIAATASPRIIRGLMRGHLYTCMVAARNTFGWGPFGGASPPMFPT